MREDWHREPTDLLVDLLEEDDLLLQGLDAPFQVQPGKSRGIHILEGEEDGEHEWEREWGT